MLPYNCIEIDNEVMTWIQWEKKLKIIEWMTSVTNSVYFIRFLFSIRINERKDNDYHRVLKQNWINWKFKVQRYNIHSNDISKVKLIWWRFYNSCIISKFDKRSNHLKNNYKKTQLTKSVKQLRKFWIGNLISDKGDWRRPHESYQNVIYIRWKWLNRL